MRPVIVSINDIDTFDGTDTLPSHALLRVMALQGADCKGLLVSSKTDVLPVDVFTSDEVLYLPVTEHQLFLPKTVDAALPPYCFEYLDVLAPNIIIVNRLSVGTAPWILAAAERGIALVIDSTNSIESQCSTALQNQLRKFATQIWLPSDNSSLLFSSDTARFASDVLAEDKQASNGVVEKHILVDGVLLYSAERVCSRLLWKLLRVIYAIEQQSNRLLKYVPGQLKIAAIMDEFTRGCFEPEADLLHLTPHNVVQQLQCFSPQLFFIESAWKGINDSWKQQVSNRGEALLQAISWCRLHQVPILFWNKEDPVHFATFLPTAAAADWVFTTDIDCIPRYKAALGHEQVALLPFAAQTLSHNPIEQYPRKDAFNFAGSYYLRYPQRQQDFSAVVEAVSRLKSVEIYDRNANNPHPHYLFPERYKPLILGALPFSEIDKAYKGYRYGINMNTIKQSQTMFARRVFELLACNTVVVSNYSRGVRNLFGELVVCSDNSEQLVKQLTPLCEDDNYYQRFRLAGLRKVMSEHTYRHRMTYIANLVLGLPCADVEPEVLIFAVAHSEIEQQRILSSYQRQKYKHKRLLLLQLYPKPVNPVLKTVTSVSTVDSALAIVAATTLPYIAFFAAEDFYAEHYLTDLLLARHYSSAKCFTKGSYYFATQGSIELTTAQPSYQYVKQVRLRASLISTPLLDVTLFKGWVNNSLLQMYTDSALSIDPFNYCYQASLLPDTCMLAAICDLNFADVGQNVTEKLYAVASKLPAKLAPNSYNSDDEQLKVYSAAQLNSLISDEACNGLLRSCDGQQLTLGCELDAQTHRYVYLRQKFTRAALNLVVNSQFQLLVQGCHGDVRTVFEFYTASGKRLGHSINRNPGEKHSLAIPEDCTHLRFGIRLQGRASVSIDRLVLGAIAEVADVVAAKAETLVLTKQYPAYDDLYKYGFLHSRVRAYRESGLAVDVFKISPGKGQYYREFEDVDVTEGNYDLLDQTLATGQYKHVLVHFLDNKKWPILQKHLDNVKVTVWVHGSEIQVWQRREYEFERLDAAEIIRQKKLSAARVKFWQSVLQPVHPNLKLVFVSDYFANESFADIGLTPSQQSYRIIHNYIDTTLFNFVAKPVQQRLRLLSIRPYASRKYANDLTIKAIQILSKKSFFPQLEICLVGDGELFDELTSPLKNMPNVRLIKGFMQHAQIAELHKSYGVFLTPTRMDSQGVSRDEAMSSGMVPITTNVAAIPEFVDNSCGFVVPAEDAEAIAAAVESLYYQPEVFSTLSDAAAKRVRRQCGYEQTIQQEIQLIGSML